MSRRKQKHTDTAFKPRHQEEFKKLMVQDEPKAKAPKFLGFRLIKHNHNQLWRWPSLEEVSL